MDNEKIDISGAKWSSECRENIKQQEREENLKVYKNIRNNGILDIIQRQTDYDKKTAAEKLETWDGNYLNVIKEWMNPNFQNVTKKEKTQTKNQMIYGEIRNFMDKANTDYLQRKRKADNLKNQKMAYLMKQQARQEAMQKALKRDGDKKIKS
jgi:hypothetical protein